MYLIMGINFILNDKEPIADIDSYINTSTFCRIFILVAYYFSRLHPNSLEIYQPFELLAAKTQKGTHFRIHDCHEDSTVRQEKQNELQFHCFPFSVWRTY